MISYNMDGWHFSSIYTQVLNQQLFTKFCHRWHHMYNHKRTLCIVCRHKDLTKTFWSSYYIYYKIRFYGAQLIQQIIKWDNKISNPISLNQITLYVSKFANDCFIFNSNLFLMVNLTHSFVLWITITTQLYSSNTILFIFNILLKWVGKFVLSIILNHMRIRLSLF